MPYAKALRHKMTRAERALWQALRGGSLGVKFRRQAPLGPDSVDCASLERNLIIEVDGGQHADCEADRVRDAWLQGQGLDVLRFWNHEVLRNLPGVLEVIAARLEPR